MKNVSTLANQQNTANANEAIKAKIYAEIKRLEKEYSAEGGGNREKLAKINALKDEYRALCGVKITPENSCTRNDNKSKSESIFGRSPIEPSKSSTESSESSGLDFTA